ncbi:GntR family transcriptional regulator [Microlunatus sp. GCM10028923]|uniref:GntR family transcriptional regulator n=1 Tax=Microlunatus sp. GCM10028923 TaxID=3273400 RepID=UPI00361FC97A
MSDQFTLAPSSLTDALFEAVRKRIVNGDIAPGEKLTELRLAGEYSVARPTAKACVERLTAVGLLRRTAHRSAVVPAFDEAEIVDLFIAREAVERSAVLALAKRKSVPAAATTAQLSIERATRERDFPSQVEADIAFHSSLVAAVGSGRLLRMHESIMGEVQLTMGQFQAHRTADPRTVAREHAEIIAEIEAGRPRKAEDALSTHLQQARERLLSHLETAATLG